MTEWTPNKANVMAVDYREFLTMSGNEFRLNYINDSVASLASVYIRGDSSPTKYSLFTSRVITCDISQQRWFRLFATSGLGYTGGSEIASLPITNTRLDATTAVGATFRTWNAPSATDNTYRVEEISLANTVQVTQSGDLATSTSLFVLPPGADFLIQFENAGVGATRFQLDIKWFEVTKDFLPVVGPA